MTSFEYIWIDADGGLRSKTKVLNVNLNNMKYWFLPFTINNLPLWNYDGSSTGQAEGSDSEVLLKPVYMCPDPFRGNNNKLVLCETLNNDRTPHKTNTRHSLVSFIKNNPNIKPLFGFEQEFFVLENNQPAGYSDSIEKLSEQGNYYCGVGNKNIRIRKFAEDALDHCLRAELKITGMNSEVAPSQWEFQVCARNSVASDQLYLVRYILQRVGELHSFDINIEPKPFQGEWNGSGCHTNFSTNKMRQYGGKEEIINFISNLESKHAEFMNYYGSGNDKRMTGKCETADYNTFTHGFGDRTASIRIPNVVKVENRGYLEDRRPGSNIDPYVVSQLLLQNVGSQ